MNRDKTFEELCREAAEERVSAESRAALDQKMCAALPWFREALETVRRGTNPEAEVPPTGLVQRIVLSLSPMLPQLAFDSEEKKAFSLSASAPDGAEVHVVSERGELVIYADTPTAVETERHVKIRIRLKDGRDLEVNLTVKPGTDSARHSFGPGSFAAIATELDRENPVAEIEFRA